MIFLTIFAGAISLALVFSTWHINRREQQERENKHSRIRVLREYSSITIHRPTHIIDNPNQHRRNSNDR